MDFLLEGFKLDERGLSFEDLKLDGEGTFCLKVSSRMRGGFR